MTFINKLRLMLQESTTKIEMLNLKQSILISIIVFDNKKMEIFGFNKTCYAKILTLVICKIKEGINCYTLGRL